MTHYNFYSDHIEVVYDDDVILDSRTKGMLRILDELSYDLDLAKCFTSCSNVLGLLASLKFIIDTLRNSTNSEDVDKFVIISNLFLNFRRRTYGHFIVHFKTSK